MHMCLEMLTSLIQIFAIQTASLGTDEKKFILFVQLTRYGYMKSWKKLYSAVHNNEEDQTNHWNQTAAKISQMSEWNARAVELVIPEEILPLIEPLGKGQTQTKEGYWLKESRLQTIGLLTKRQFSGSCIAKVGDHACKFCQEKWLELAVLDFSEGINRAPGIPMMMSHLRRRKTLFGFE